MAFVGSWDEAVGMGHRGCGIWVRGQIRGLLVCGECYLWVIELVDERISLTIIWGFTLKV